MSKEDSFYAGFSEQLLTDWQEVVSKELKGSPIEKLRYRSADGLEYLPFYTTQQLPQHVEGHLPADFPYRRGLSASGNDWAAVAHIAIDMDVKKANRQALHALNHGADALWFDGRVADFDAFETLCKDIQPQYIRLIFSGIEGLVLAEWLGRWAENLQLSPAAMRVALLWPATAWPVDGAVLLQMAHTYRKQLTAVVPFLISSAAMRAEGAGLIEETALALAAGHDLLHRLVQAGLSVDEAAPLIQFQLALDTDYFAEICRLRAFRQAWAKIVQTYAPVHSCSAAATLHALAGSQALYSLDRHTNLLRLTSMGMSAVIGGVASLCLPAFDLPVHGGDDFSMELSLQIQLMLRYEARLNEVADPAGGAYFLESLTEQIGEKSWALFQDIERVGGFMSWQGSGALDVLLKAGAQSREQALGNRKQIRVGVNQYPNGIEVLADWQAASLHNAFDALRLQTARALPKPRIYLATTGDLTMRMARLNFSMNFLGCAGYELMAGKAFSKAEEAAEEALAAGAHALVLCCDDASWPEAVAGLSARLKGNMLLILAGNPAAMADEFKAAGFEFFIHLKANVLDTLQSIQSKLLRS
ncbi:MAG: methylmalonyl-CoA mutase family protein [Bacteroidia bacterium]